MLLKNAKVENIEYISNEALQKIDKWSNYTNLSII